MLARADVEALDRPFEFRFRFFAARQRLVVKRVVGALGYEGEGVGLGRAGACGSRKQRASLLGLEAAHGVLQSRLARELRLKRTPQLTFEYDPTVERGVRMTHLIDELAPDDE